MKIDIQTWLEFLTNLNGVLHHPDSEKSPKKPVSFSHKHRGSVTKNIDPGLKLTQVSFFNVEYWPRGHFSSLNIETKYFSTA